MKRILIFAGLKVAEISAAVLVYALGVKGGRWLSEQGDVNSGVSWLETYVLNPATFALAIMAVGALVYMFGLVVLPAFIKANWRAAGRLSSNKEQGCH